MMTRERELLKRWVNGWGASNMILLEETKELLAQPEQEPLNNREIAILWGDMCSGSTEMVRNFARAVERVHAIGDRDE